MLAEKEHIERKRTRPAGEKKGESILKKSALKQSRRGRGINRALKLFRISMQRRGDMDRYHGRKRKAPSG